MRFFKTPKPETIVIIMVSRLTTLFLASLIISAHALMDQVDQRQKPFIGGYRITISRDRSLS